MNPTSAVPVRRRDPLAVVAFVLAVLIMVVPVEVGILDPALRGHRFVGASIVAAFFFAVVFAPFFLAVRRRRREPSVWRGGGFLIATGVILVLNIVWFASILIYQLFR
jgi:hypothetical protein